MNIINVLEQEQLRTDIPTFRAGDTVRVHVKVVMSVRSCSCSSTLIMFIVSSCLQTFNTYTL